MKYKLEEVRVPWENVGAMGGKIDYVEGDPQIQVIGYKNRDEVKLIETSEVTIRLSGLPQELQDLWNDFKIGVENWVKEQEDGKV